MLYALQSPTPAPLSPFLVRDRPHSGYAAGPGVLREFISSRLDRVDPYAGSEEYCCQQERAARLHDRLLSLLPADGRAALREYAEALGDAHCLEVEMLAERAFLDGVRLVLWAMTDAAGQGEFRTPAR